MLRWTTLIAAAGLTLAAVGCDQNDKGKASTENTPPAAPNEPNMKPVTPTNATVPTAPVDPLSRAENKDQVTQYTDMIRLAPTPGKIVTGLSTSVRGSPRGQEVQIVETGMTVDVIGKRDDYYLVLYPDPRDATKQLAGWVYKDAVDAATWPGIVEATKLAEKEPGAPQNAKTASPAKLSCKTGERELRSQGDFCARECSKDDDCTKSPGGLCDGVAYEVKKDGTTAPAMSRYCILSSANVDRAEAKGNTTTTPPAVGPKPHP
jgi:hypothetical protein